MTWKSPLKKSNRDIHRPLKHSRTEAELTVLGSGSEKRVHKYNTRTQHVSRSHGRPADRKRRMGGRYGINAMQCYAMDACVRFYTKRSEQAPLPPAPSPVPPHSLSARAHLRRVALLNAQRWPLTRSTLNIRCASRSPAPPPDSQPHRRSRRCRIVCSSHPAQHPAIITTP